MFGHGLATLAAQNNTLSDDKKVDSTDLYGGFPLQFSGDEKLKLDDLYRQKIWKLCETTSLMFQENKLNAIQIIRYMRCS